jgi:hypothetical protein
VAWATDRSRIAVPSLSITLSRTRAVPDSDHSLELEQENTRMASGCMQMGHGDLGTALKSEIQRLAGGQPADPESARKHELACLRMAADCMQLVGEVLNPDLQRHFLELARQLTTAAESAAVSAFTPSA